MCSEKKPKAEDPSVPFLAHLGGYRQVSCHMYCSSGEEGESPLPSVVHFGLKSKGQSSDANSVQLSFIHQREKLIFLFSQIITLVMEMLVSFLIHQGASVGERKKSQI